jgi:hypothetical protein
MKRRFLSLLTPLLLLSSGCVSVPQTELVTPIGRFAFPKNVEIEGLQISKQGTNITITVAKYRAKNDPAVIAASAAGQADLVKASLEGGATIAGEVAARLK